MPYCRILDNTNVELARYELGEGGSESGLLISRLFREHGGRWGFQALGQFCRGNTWKDSVPDMLKVLDVRPQDLQHSIKSKFADVRTASVVDADQCSPCSVQ